MSIVETASGLPVLGEMTLASGYEVTYQFWVGPTPMHPPSPPRDPPGVIKHETCHLLIRGIRGPGNGAGWRSGLAPAPPPPPPFRSPRLWGSATGG